MKVEIVAPNEEEERGDGNLQLKKFDINDYYDVETKVNTNKTIGPAVVEREIFLITSIKRSRIFEVS